MAAQEKQGVLHGSHVPTYHSIGDNTQGNGSLGNIQKRTADTEDCNEVSRKNAAKRTTHATSDFETLIHLLKGNIGTGILALPMATKGAGYILGPFGIILLGMIAMHCMVLLVESANRLCLRYKVPALDYSETMQFAVKERGASPKNAKIAKYIVNFFLIVTQFGFCSVYLVFVGQSLQQIMVETYCVNLDKRAWIAIVVLPVIFLSWIRNLDHLSSLSALANLCILCGLAVIVYDEVFRFTTDGPSKAQLRRSDVKLHPFGHAENLALFFGNALFSYEAIGVVLPLENKMKKPTHAKYVIYLGMTIVTFLYSSFGLIGYLTYGDNIQASITLNLCPTNFITAIVFMLTKALFAYSIFMSYLLQFYVPMDFLEPIVLNRLRVDKLASKYSSIGGVIHTGAQMGLRTALVLVTAALAISVPDLGDLLTLIGAIASSGLAMIFPPLIHMLTFWRDRDEKCLSFLPRPVWVIKDLAIITLGVVGCAFGTFASFNSIINYFEHSDTGVYCEEHLTADSFQTYCHLIHSSTSN